MKKYTEEAITLLHMNEEYVARYGGVVRQTRSFKTHQRRVLWLYCKSRLWHLASNILG